MQRIAVVGTTGSGKTTLAERLARTLRCPFIELDALFWGPDWARAPTDIFRERVAAALAGERWTVGGNYGMARDLIWARADTLIWLDYPLPFVLWRLLRRTLRRIVTREELWAGNRETWRAQFFSRDSLFVWALQTHARYRREFLADLGRPAYAHLHWVRHRSARAAERWLDSAGQAGG